jgi:hypothetical protein
VFGVVTWSLLEGTRKVTEEEKRKIVGGRKSKKSFLV